MDNINYTRQELLITILQKIIDCEGGKFEIIADKNSKESYIIFTTDIPYKNWCNDCKKRIECKRKLIKRWRK